MMHSNVLAPEESDTAPVTRRPAGNEPDPSLYFVRVTVHCELLDDRDVRTTPRA
jgi:hypothetical protein